MSMPTLNVDLLSRLIRWAVADKEGLDEEFQGWPHWDQSFWGRQVVNGHCTTFCCIAGNAVQQTPGWSLDWSGFTDEHISWARPTITMRAKDGSQVEVIDPARYHEGRYISDLAREVLGLDPAEAHALFDGDNEVGDVVFVALTAAEVRDLDLDLPDHIKALAEDTRYSYDEEHGSFYDDND